MLPVHARLRNRELLTMTVRRGKRAGRSRMVVHYLPATCGPQSSGVQLSDPHQSPRVAFAVNRAVGGSVVRHRVIRRLRHVVMAHLDRLPAGSTMVVRALPPAALASSADLDRDLVSLLSKVVKPCK